MATFPQEPGRRWTRSSLLPACWRACSQHPEESWNIRDGFYYGTLRYKTRYGCTVNTLRGLFKWCFLLFRQLKWQQHKRWHAGRRAGELSAEARLVGCNPEGALLDAQPLHWWDETFPCCWLVTRVTLTVFFFLKKQSLSTQGQTATQEFARHVGQTNTTPPDRTRMTLSRQKRRKSPLKVDRKCSATNCSKTFKDW